MYESLPPDSIIYRMSKSGYCVRALVASQYDMPERRTPKTQDLLDRSADEGRLHEVAIREQLRAQGYVIVGEQDEYVLDILPKVFLVGHGDGFISAEPGLNDEEYFDLHEIKSMSSKQFSKWQSGKFTYFPGYAAQITSYMKSNPGRRVRYDVKRREDGLLSTMYIPADEPPLDFKDIRKKIVTAELYRRRGDYPACDLDKQARFFCPFWYLHEEEEESEEDAEPLSEEVEMALSELVVTYLDLKAREDDGKTAAAQRKDGGVNQGILNLLGNKSKVKVTIGDRTFEVKKQGGGGGKRIDIDALRAQEPEVAERFEKRDEKFEYPVVKEIE